MCPERLIGAQLLQLGRFPRELDDLVARARRCAGESDIRAVDPKLVHQLEQALLDADRRIAHRWTLQTVAERLVVELDGTVVRLHRAAVAVPVVDETIELAHGPAFGVATAA